MGGRQGMGHAFKHPDDPRELKNLSYDPAYGKVVAEMKGAVKQFFNRLSPLQQ